ncbi:MAG: ATP-binding protein [Pseudomonadota bacterium]
MITIFVLHVVLFSSVALALTILPRPTRAVSFYAYMSVILLVGGFLGNAYSLPISDSVTVSGGNLAYGAFMLTAVLFVLAERDVFILRRLIVLVIGVDAFNILLSLLITQTIGTSGTINPHDTPSALFENAIPLIVLGGVLIILELGLMLFLFEWIKRLNPPQMVVRVAYMVIFVAVLCFDGIAFPLIAFGTAPEIVAIVIGGFNGKLLTALAYSCAVLAFMLLMPRRFAAYLDARVLNWRTVQSSSSEIIRDLEQRDAELTQTQSRILHSAELAGLGYAIYDPHAGQVVECDETYARMHGMTAHDLTTLDVKNGIIAKLIRDDNSDKSAALIDKLEHGETVTEELRHVRPDGEVRSLRKVFTPIYPDGRTDHLYEVVGQDVTETRQLQERLFQSQKMDAIGKLTGGVAHDFNNLLAVTLGNLELLRDELTDEDHRELVQNGITATLRGAELTKNMLSFARQAPLNATIVDLNEIVRASKKWISRTLPSTIEVNTVHAPDLWPIRIDAASTESSLLNLIVNARDAMPDGGTLTISTTNVAIEDGSEEASTLDLAPDRYVMLKVADTGEGILPENIKRIFDPFFTTKRVGVGSGLGLSMVDGFMQQSGGAVRVTSDPGAGTTFRLFFVAAEAQPAQDAKAATAPMRADDVKDAKILLVEDNVDVLHALRRTLEKNGYRVRYAFSGDEAYAAFQANPEIDLLVTDIVMPGKLQGNDLADALRVTRSDLPVLLMSGYAREEASQTADTHATDTRLMKPVQRDDLLRAVRHALVRQPD